MATEKGGVQKGIEGYFQPNCRITVESAELEQITDIFAEARKAVDSDLKKLDSRDSKYLQQIGQKYPLREEGMLVVVPHGNSYTLFVLNHNKIRYAANCTVEKAALVFSTVGYLSPALEAHTIENPGVDSYALGRSRRLSYQASPTMAREDDGARLQNARQNQDSFLEHANGILTALRSKPDIHQGQPYRNIAGQLS